MTIKMRLPIALILGLLFTTKTVAQEWNLASPNKKINVRILNQEKISYSVTYDGHTVINASPLGIQLDDQHFGEGLKLLGRKEASVKEDYKLLIGKRLKPTTQGMN